MPFLAPALATPILGGLLTVGQLVSTAGAIGLQLIAQEMARAEAEKRAAAVRGSELSERFGIVNRDIIFGTCATRGVFCPPTNAFGPSNDTVEQVHLLSSWRISAINRVWREGAWHGLSGGDARGTRVEGTEAEIYHRWKPGRMDQAADALLISNSGGRRASTARGAGIAYSVTTSIYHQEHLTNPEKLVQEVTGPLLYDPRGDSTAGGTGNQRWDDPDTWAGRPDNPALQILALLRGLRNGSELVAGLGLPAARTRIAETALAANICDEIVDGEYRYSNSMILKCGDENTTAMAIAVALISMAGTWVPAFGGGFPQAGASLPIAATLSDADIVWRLPVDHEMARHPHALVNTVTGTYPDPAKGYEGASYGVRSIASALTADGRRRATTIDYPGVRSAKQAQRLTDIYLRSNRHEGRLICTLGARHNHLQFGEKIRIQSAELGIDQEFIIERRRRRGAREDVAPFGLDVTLQQTGPGVFDPSAYSAALPAPVRPALPVRVSELFSFSVTGVITPGPVGGRDLAAADFAIGWPADPTVTGAEIRWWPTAQPERAQSDVVMRPTAAQRETGNVVSGTPYQAQYRLLTEPDRNAPWTAPVAFTTPVVTEPLVGWDGLSAEVRLLLTDADERMAELSADTVVDAWHDIYAMAGTMLESAQHMRETGDSSARITRETRLLATETEALASEITTFGAAIAGKADASLVDAQGVRVTALEGLTTAQGSSITAINTALPNKAETSTVTALSGTVTAQGASISALSSAMTAVEAQTDAGTANGLVGWEAISAPGGVSARYAITGKVSAGGVEYQGGAFLDVLAGSARWAFISDQVVFIDSAGNPFALFGPGGAVLNSAVVTNLTAGSLNLNELTRDALLSGTSTSGDMGSVTLTGHEAGTTLKVTIAMDATASYQWPTGSGTRTGHLTLYCDDGAGTGRVVATKQFGAASGSSSTASLALDRTVLDIPATRGDKTVRYYYRAETVGGINVTAANCGPTKMFYARR